MRFRRFVAAFVAASVVAASCAPVAHADWEDVVHKHVVVPFTDLFVHAIQALGDIVQAGGSELRDIVVDDYEFWTQWIREESLEYKEFLSTLDSTEANASISVTGFSASAVKSTATSYGFSYRLPLGLYDHRESLCSMLKNLGIYSKVLVSGQNEDYLYGYCFLSDGSMAIGVFTNPLGSVSASLFGVYDIAQLDAVYFSQGDEPKDRLYYSKQYAEAAAGSDFATSELYALTFDDVSDDAQSNYWSVGFDCFYKKSSASTWAVDTAFRTHTWSALKPYIYGNCSLYIPDSSTIALDNSRIVVAPSGTDDSSRTYALMEALNAYNSGNSYVDNSTTVNYFIGSLGSDGSVTDVYSPVLYDEETLIFTEPVTGTQYQTNGWTYDYTSRSYYMTLDSGTMYIDGTEVTAVYLVYGDDNVEISYFSGSGGTELIQTDTYAYVMVSQSTCNINGHTYTYEDVSAPTCTTPGERKYTCSVCGNEYAEDIPASGGHAYEYSIYQVATCTTAGIGLYVCSGCGDQYTEPIAATGHIDQILETVPTVYDDEGIVVSLGYTVYECTVCGDQRRVNDEIPEESHGLISGITSAIVSFAKKAWSAISSGIGKVFGGFADLLGGIFGFFTDTVVGGIKSFFSTLSDDSILGYYQDDTGTVTLPEGMSSAMATIPSFFGALPAELQAPVIFGIAALFLIAALKLFL